MVTMTIGVSDMMCNNCEKHVNEAIKKAFKVKKVESSFEKKETVITAKEVIPEEELKAVITDAGYQFAGIISVA